MNYSLPLPTQKYEVLVRCFTFNQSRFIQDALNGFVIQQTTFPYVCLVMDDASTDGEQEVIKKYLSRECDMSSATYYENELSACIRVPHLTNVNCTFFVCLLKKNLYRETGRKIKLLEPWRKACKYEALCEGDDLWTDCCKLQKQYDALENDALSSFVYTGFNVIDESGNVLEKNPFAKRLSESHSGVLFFDLLVNMNYIMTLTTFFRIEVLLENDPFYYDYGIFLSASRQGRGLYLPDITACYRINPASIMNTNPDSLLPFLYRIVLIEINKSLYNKKTSLLVSQNKMHKSVVGYIIARYINRSLIRQDYFSYLVSHPSLWLYAIKGGLIRMFCDSAFREHVRQMK